MEMNTKTRTVVGVDTAKSVFALYWIDVETGEIANRTLRRGRFLAHFEGLAPCLVGMEACGGSHHWARELVKLGHEVRLLPTKMVKPFAGGGNKSDAHDARAIWRAVQQPDIRCVAIKSEGQQAVLALHRMRQELVKFRTAQINGLRGLLTEYGEVMPKGRAGMKRDLAGILARLSDRLPAMVIESWCEQWARIGALDMQIKQIETRLARWHRQDAASLRIAGIPGVGLLTATAAAAAMGDPAVFRSGREFAAWAGLVPRHTGTGGRVQMHGISKRGDRYLRTLLIHGARSVLTNSRTLPAWITRLLARRPRNVVIVALANRMARMIWALLAHGRTYRADHVSRPPLRVHPA